MNCNNHPIKNAYIIYQIYQMSPRQLPTVARQGSKFLFKKLIEAPNLPASGDQVCS